MTTNFSKISDCLPGDIPYHDLHKEVIKGVKHKSQSWMGMTIEHQFSYAISRFLFCTKILKIVRNILIHINNIEFF